MIALLMLLRNVTPGPICGVHLHLSYMSGNGRAFAVSTTKNQLFLMFIAFVDREEEVAHCLKIRGYFR